ncbi:MAG TPA: hypothetical protein VMS86_05575 [Thermoanaerobaculia bacterium]|nr:hypothetical protein [Thermoanaerobaculia bacterium]
MLATASLLCWLAPPAIALATLMHVVSDHPHRGEHRALELALAATHGHSHQLATAEHRHAALRESAPSAVPRPLSAVAVASAIELASVDGRPALPDRPPPTGSPPLLFYRHCALLL